MAISVDSSYYYDVYMGKEYDDIDRCLKRAADIIDSMIIVEPVTEMQITAYKKAVCAEAEYIANCGGTSDINEGKGAASFSLGKFSYSSGSSGGSSAGISDKASTLAVMYLDKAGLLYRGLG